LSHGSSFLRDGGDELRWSTSCRGATHRSFLSGSTRWTRRYLDVGGPVVLFGSPLPWLECILARCSLASMASMTAFSFYILSSPHLTNRCSRRRAGVLLRFQMIKTLQPAATRGPARRG